MPGLPLLTHLDILFKMISDDKITAIKNWLGSGSINIIGRPFSGKDCQGNKLAELLGGNLIGGGDLLRNSHNSDRVRSFIDQGHMLPSDEYLAIVTPYLHQTQFEKQPLILSAVGRWHGEETAIIQALNLSNHDLKLVIHLDISTDESKKRWINANSHCDRGDRADDNEIILAARQKEFQDKTLPVIEFYKNLGILIEVDGNKNRDDVTSAIIDSIFEKISN